MQRTHKTSKNEQPDKIWAKDLNIFSKDIQTAMKRCSTNHQGNTNKQNQWHPHTCQNGCYWKRQQITTVGKDTENTEPLWTAGGNVNWYRHCGKQ